MQQRLTASVVTAAIAGFEQRKVQIDAKIAELRNMLSGGSSQPVATPEAAPRKRRTFSAATRKRMREAQRLRWAKLRGESGSAAPAPKKKRRLSAAGRKAIVAATKRRWALKRLEAAKAKKATPARKKAVVRKVAKRRAPVKGAAA